MIMKKYTEAASIITHYNDKKTYDMYCKRLLSNKQILAYVMKACIPEFADIPLEDIPSYIEMSSIKNTAECEHIHDQQIEVTDESIPGSQIKYDIQFEAMLPFKQKKAGKGTSTEKRLRMIINLESQARDDPGYPLIKRALYYCGRLMAKQKHPKDGFQHSDYGSIKKVCSIWICIGHNNQKNDVINTYQIQETCETNIWHAAKEDYDLITAVMVYPKKETVRNGKAIPYALEHMDENKQRLLELLKILFIKNLAVEDKKEQLQKGYGILMERELDKEVMNMCNFSDFIEQRGIEQGLLKGKAEGKTEGKVEATLLHVKKLMQRINVSAMDAMNILDVEEDIRPSILQALHHS
ncbi:hypothetical protein [[Clostridium] innocuum]|uniref:hypothetical protein n=2 Tax=Bacillati TaxID=1783272 RepID=UPI001AF29B5D|nr:hypothetical protein [[Clostridium] innocuum]QSI27263.1 hypothetical protein GKZ87_18095 [Erysipelotrichaceae bacterium 66202529]MCR0246793.1 hypothetical protein [[Clostridium] innocuum]MCR0259868.1 hypothetical protein [[Clostridium] innocuum]MCR0391348.1 hypothetical protein [[Clostridium] innocuum]